MTFTRPKFTMTPWFVDAKTMIVVFSVFDNGGKVSCWKSGDTFQKMDSVLLCKYSGYSLRMPMWVRNGLV